MACDEYKALLPGQAEGRLTADQERLLKDHLRNCDSCRSTLRILRMDDKAIRGALLGVRPTGAVEPGRRRAIRVLILSTVFVLLVVPVLLFGLWALDLFYRALVNDSGPWGDLPGTQVESLTAGRLAAPITWKGGRLGDLLDEVSRATDRDVVIDPGELSARSETVALAHPVAGPAGDVLEDVLRTRGLTFDDRFGVLYVASPERLAALSTIPAPLSARLAAKTVTLSFEQLPLCEALDTLGRLKGVEIVLSTKIAARAAEERLTIDFKGIRLTDALALILFPRGLTYAESYAESGGMIVVRGEGKKKLKQEPAYPLTRSILRGKLIRDE